MRVLSPLGNKKRGVSVVVAYVILISISIALSIMVYNWLKFYVGDEDVPKCPEGVNIIIKDYSCESGSSGGLNVTLKNKGRFTVAGYSLRVHNRTGASFGFYLLNDTGTSIAPGEEYLDEYPFNVHYDDFSFESVTLVEVQPFMMEDDKISCRSHAFQEVSCS